MLVDSRVVCVAVVDGRVVWVELADEDGVVATVGEISHRVPL